MWVLALIRSKEGIVHDVALHTKKDLFDALEKAGKEPSKRGLLASLLRSQLGNHL